MTFIETIPPADASGLLAELFGADEAAFGHVANFTRAFSLRPEVYAAWKQLNGAVKAGMELRTYELATVAAARRLRSSYCMLAHGSILASEFLGEDAVRAVAADHRDAGLDEADVAVMDLAGKVADDAFRDAMTVGRPIA
jgi:alkylhydroperoxidase family enzyme